MKRKKLLIFALLLGLATLIGGGVLLANLDRIAQALKPKLESTLSGLLNANVTLGSISASVFPRTSLKAADLRIAPKDGGQGITLKSAALSAKLTSLLAGKLDISAVTLDEPSISVLIDAAGTRVEGLGSSGEREPGKTSATDSTGAGPGKGASDWLSLNLNSLEVRNASISVRDLPGKRDFRVLGLDIGASCEIRGAAISSSRIKANGKLLPKMDFALEAGDLKANIERKTAEIASLRVSALGQTISISGRLGGADGGMLDISAPSGLNLEKISTGISDILPVLSAIQLKGSASPNLKATLGSDGPSAKGAVKLEALGLSLPAADISDLSTTLSLDGSKSKQTVKSEDLRLNLGRESVAGTLNLEASTAALNLTSLRANLFGGRAELQAVFNLSGKTFDSSFSAASLKIDRILSSLKIPPMPLEGTVNRIQAKISGRSGEGAAQSLSGPLSVELIDSSIVGVNIAGDALRAVKGLPFLSDSLFAAVPSDKRASLESTKTQVKSLLLDASLGGGSIAVKSLSAVSDIFSLDASGAIGFDGSVNLNANILFDRAFSESLAQKTKELRSLFNQEGKLVIPMKITGKSPKLAVLPDLAKLAETGAKKLIETKGEKLLNKFLGGKSGSGKSRGLGGFGF